MNKLAAVDVQSDRPGEAAADHMVARVRLLMIIAAVTTLMAIAAVVGVVGYRIYRSGGAGATTPAEATITLPKGARVVASSVTDDRMTLTLDIAGAAEIRISDLKTLKQTARIRFATEP
jgi:hypothetical protein